MQRYESASFQMLCHQHDTPTFKTNALRLVINAKTSFAAI